MAMTKRNEKVFSYCIKHDRSLPVNQFYPSSNSAHKGYVPYCKECCQAIYEKHYEHFQDMEAALWFTCADMGIPFIEHLYNRTKGVLSRKKTGKPVEEYINCMRTYRGKPKAWNDFSDTDTSFGDIRTEVVLDAEREEEIKKLKMAWGDDLSVDDLGYLEWRFLTYTNGVDLTEYQASRYRDLCLCELRIKKDVETQANMKIKTSIAKELGIDKFDANAEKTEADKYIENRIYIMEKYEPAEYYKDQELYKDFLGIHKYWIDWVLRPVKNLIIGSKDYNVTTDGKYGDTK